MKLDDLHLSCFSITHDKIAERPNSWTIENYHSAFIITSWWTLDAPLRANAGKVFLIHQSIDYWSILCFFCMWSSYVFLFQSNILSHCHQYCQYSKLHSLSFINNLLNCIQNTPGVIRFATILETNFFARCIYIFGIFPKTEILIEFMS